MARFLPIQFRGPTENFEMVSVGFRVVNKEGKGVKLCNEKVKNRRRGEGLEIDYDVDDHGRWNSGNEKTG